MAIQKIVITASGGTVTIADNNIFNSYYVTSGTISLLASFAITMNAPRNGQRVRFEYNPGTITLGGNTISFMGVQMPDDYASKKVNVDCYYDGGTSAWTVDYTPAFQQSDIINDSMIKDVSGTKLTAASVPMSKLNTLTASRAVETTAGGVLQASATTTTELGYIAGVSPGTVADNKAIVPTTGKVINEIDITTLKKGGVAVTSTAAELNTLAGVTAGTAAASKALVLDSSSKITGIAELNTTVLKINNQTVAASGTELSELNSAGVVNADFVVLKHLAANGVVEADLALLAGLDAAGLTGSSITDMCHPTAAPAKVQTKTDIVNTDATVDENTGLVILTMTADTTLTLPTGSGNSKQVIDVIIKANAASAYDLILVDTGSTFWSAGASASNTITVQNPAPGSLVKISNCDTNVWVVGAA